MLKRYRFSNDVIVESVRPLYESQDSNKYDLQEAIDAVKKKGFFDEIDENECVIQDWGVWPVALIYGKINKNKRYDNNIAIYSFNKGDIINDHPIYRFKKYGDYAEVGIYIDKGDYSVDNILNDNGFVFDEEVYLNCIDPKKGLFIIEGDGFANITDKNGKFFFDDNKDYIRHLDSGAIFVEDFKEDTGYLYDENLNLKIENVKDVSCIEVNFKDCGGEEYFYIIKPKTHGTDYGRDYKLYNENFKLVANGIHNYIDEISDHTWEAQIIQITHEWESYRKNILAPGGKLLFGNGDPNNTDGWYNEIEEDPNGNEHISMIKRDGKYAFLNRETLMLELDGTWFDDIHMLDFDVLGMSGVICTKVDGKCNIICKQDSDAPLEYMLSESVDDVKVYEDIDFVFVTKNNQDYLLWCGRNLVSVPADKFWKTEDSYTYIYKIDDKYDLINVDDDKTFCEKYLNNKKFDFCYDKDSFYPMMEIDGKIMFVDAESFKPGLSRGTDKIRLFDDATPVKEINGDLVFKVLEDGVVKKLDDWGDEIE